MVGKARQVYKGGTNPANFQYGRGAWHPLVKQTCARHYLCSRELLRITAMGLHCTLSGGLAITCVNTRLFQDGGTKS